MTFGIHLGIDFHEILDFVIICENHPNAYIQSIWVGSAHSKPHIFRPKFNQKFILFLMPHSGPHFSTFWRVLMPNCGFWDPPGAQLGTKWRPKSPKWRQKGPNRVGWAAHIGAQLPGSFSGALLGTLLVDFGSRLAPKS